MMGRSIAGRLALMFGLAVAIVSTIAGIALFAFQASELNRHKRDELSARFNMIERMAVTSPNWDKFREKLVDFSTPDGSLRFMADSADTRDQVGADFLAKAQWTGPREGFGNLTQGDRHYIALARTVPVTITGRDVRLVIASSKEPLNNTLEALAAGIAVMSFIAISAVSILGWVIARRSLLPVDRISGHARLIGAANLSARLPTEALPVELAGLVLSLNAALDRVEDSYIRLSAFNSDVAHELRTPLGNLIGATQVALSRSRQASELEEVLQSNLEELDRLRRIINDMLFLARADQGELAGNLTPSSLAAETRKTADFLDVVMEEAGVILDIDGDVILPIECALYGRAISNLLDNAIRHGQTPGRVIVTIRERTDFVEIGVSSPGGPIDQAHLGRIFDRLYRIDSSRTDSDDSHGLGLAVVKAVARMHGGEVFAYNEPGRVCVGFTIARTYKAAQAAKTNSSLALAHEPVC
jgi:two-component system, OmpR family, heavy metal sensor histidine kinase CusS